MLIVPRRFDQQPADQCVPGSRDPTAPMFLTAGVLTRHEAHIRHQRRGGREPLKVVQLGQQQHGRQGIDSTETPQPADAFPIGVRLGDLAQPDVELDQTRLQMMDRQHIVVHDHALRGLRPLETLDPAPVGFRPVAPGMVQAPTQEQLAITAGSTPCGTRASTRRAA